MDLILFSKAIGIGIAIAAPVGPIAVMCVYRSLKYGWWPGFFTGLGAAAADALLAAISIFGLSVALPKLFDRTNWFQPACGIILIILGALIYLEKPINANNKTTALQLRNLAGNWLSAFLVTVLNPATIFAFIAVFGGFKIGDSAVNSIQKITVVVGVFVGASIWWIGLTTAAARFRRGLNPKTMSAVNRFGGTVVVGFGVFTIIDWGFF